MYTAKILDLKTEGWGSVKIGIFQNEELIYSFEHNYPNKDIIETNIKFLKYGSKHYCLFTECYNNLVMLSLPDLKQVGRISLGSICPIDLYIPEYAIEPDQLKYPGLVYIDNDGEENLDYNNTLFGFMLAAIWGGPETLIYGIDIDFKKENCLEITDKYSKSFGKSISIDTDKKIKLKDFIYINDRDSSDPNKWRVTFHVPTTFEVVSGKYLDI